MKQILIIAIVACFFSCSTRIYGQGQAQPSKISSINNLINLELRSKIDDIRFDTKASFFRIRYHLDNENEGLSKRHNLATTTAVLMKSIEQTLELFDQAILKIKYLDLQSTNKNEDLNNYLIGVDENKGIMYDLINSYSSNLAEINKLLYSKLEPVFPVANINAIFTNIPLETAIQLINVMEMDLVMNENYLVEQHLNQTRRMVCHELTIDVNPMETYDGGLESYMTYE